MLRRIALLSGLALQHHINVQAGVVDEDYHGKLSMIFFNHTDKQFHVSRGDRLAQLICQNIYYSHPEEVKELDDNERGKNGFGSTGRN